MQRKIRLICLIIAIAFVAVFVFSIAVSVAGAEGLGEAGARGETVYIEADANGNPRSMVSSVYISNPDQAESVTDHTTLTQVKNITGSEPPVIEGTALTFAANGEDVCYQGTATGELPFSVNVSYYLNGSLITPEEIAGKSGKIRIEVKTENKLPRKTLVDGREMTLYVPFSIICMLSLDESFTSIEASGAKISAQAGQVTIMSVLLPGLAESLGAQDNDQIKDSFTIEAQVENFGLGSMMFIGMTGIIDENDLSGIEDIEGLVEALSDISEASTALYRGAKGLRDGLSSVTDGFALYAEGIGTAADGADQAADGAGQLEGGMATLSGGLQTYAASIDDIADVVRDARNALNAAADPNAPIDQAIKQLVLDAVNTALRENAASIEANLRTQLDAQLAPFIPDAGARAAAIDSIIAGLNLSGITVDVSDETIRAICNAVFATDAARELITLANELADVVDALASGAAELAGGAKTLTSAMGELAGGLQTLASGLDELDANGETMHSALVSLTRGSRSLTTGLKKLSEEGLQAIVDETDEIGVSLSRKDALLALAEGYTSFTGTEPRAGDTVQFMLTTDEIEPELPIVTDPETTPAPETSTGTEEGFFARVGEWFTGVFDAIRSWFA